MEAWILSENFETAIISSIVDRLAFVVFLFATSLALLIFFSVFFNAWARFLSSLFCQKRITQDKIFNEKDCDFVASYIQAPLYFLLHLDEHKIHNFYLGYHWHYFYHKKILTCTLGCLLKIFLTWVLSYVLKNELNERKNIKAFIKLNKMT